MAGFLRWCFAPETPPRVEAGAAPEAGVPFVRWLFARESIPGSGLDAVGKPPHGTSIFTWLFGRETPPSRPAPAPSSETTGRHEN
ncbi:MAG: hypothetical protein C0395_04965 [Gemmatimonas sp.]|nr:hypothetical protein [Gemmatimonas sp.]